MTEMYDAVVVGAGPAGVSAAWPLAESGMRIAIVDAGLPESVRRPVTQMSLTDMRRHPDRTGRIAGGIAVSDVGPELSPRIRLLERDAAPRSYLSENRIDSDGFAAIGALAAGGLSTVWGSSVAEFSTADLEDWPITADDLKASYAKTAERIGVSGRTDDAMAHALGLQTVTDPPIPPDGVARELIGRYAQKPSPGLKLGSARNAVITRDRPARTACRLDKACILGCGIGAVYSAENEFNALAARRNVTDMRGILVEAVERAGDGWRVIGRDRTTGAAWQCAGRRVLLAAGVLASTRLVLAARREFDRPRRLLNTPAATLAFLIPALLGRPLPDKGFGLAQLSYELAQERDRSFGLLYSADSFLAGDLARIPLVSRRGAASLLRSLIPALALSMLYFPGSRSRNSVSLDHGGRLRVNGGVEAGFDAERRRVFRNLRRCFAGLGAYMLPGVSRMLAPGAEVHYAGTLPMGADTSVDCEVNGLSGLFVVDGSVLPSLPAKSHTFTVMANALRAGEIMAHRLSAAP